MLTLAGGGRPVGDFLFGFALVTATLLLWARQEVRGGDVS
jgi:hypothetical protein